MNDNAVLRPPHVKVAVTLLVLYLAFGLAKAAVHYPPTNTTLLCVLIAFFGLMVFWIRLIYQGTSWARWLFVAWFA